MRKPEDYRPDIDGLRALAVAAVLLFHYGVPWISGGFVGVDVFFVISGFLITRIITPDIAAGKFSLLAFYEARLRRIGPALFLVLLCCAGISVFLFLPNDMRLLGASLVNAALFTSNIFFYALAEDYFAASTLRQQPLLHCWSLAVEAQFYLLYPALLLAGRRLAIAPARLLEIIILLSLAGSAWGAFQAPSATFYLLPTRAWELALGGLAALGRLPAPQGCRAAGSCLLSGLGLIALGVFAYDRTTPFPGLAALPPCLGAVLVILAGEAPEASVCGIGRILRARPLVFIGRLSYSLYLWHWPLLVFARYGRSAELAPAVRLALLGLSLVLALISWRLVERPFITRRLLSGRRALLAGAAFAAALTAAAGESFVLAGQGLLPIARLPPEVLTLANGQFDILRGDCAPADLKRASGLPCAFGASGVPASVLLWGNSYARMWSPTLDIDAARHGLAGRSLLLSKCLPLIGADFAGGSACAAFNTAALDYIRVHPALKTVILGANWFAAGERLRGLAGTIAALKALDRRIVIILAPPQPTFAVPRALALAALRHGPPPSPIDADEARLAQKASTDLIMALQAQYGFTLIDPAAWLCEGKACAIARNGHALYFDAGHVTLYAARLAAGLFDPVFTPSDPPPK